MSETALTKELKKAVRLYKPALPSSMRTVRWAEEVTTGTGIVDSIRFEDYVKEDNSFCRREKCKFEKEDTKVNKKKCHGCVYKRTEHILDMLITCFEIKISKSDFKSKHGHNFVGNHNYYVVPKELYPKIKELVEEGIGIIVYYPSGTLIKKKECEFKEVDKDMKIYLLFNSLKKWVDEGDKILYYKGIENQCKRVTKQYEKLHEAIWKEIDHDKLHQVYDKYDL